MKNFFYIINVINGINTINRMKRNKYIMNTNSKKFIKNLKSCFKNIHNL